MQLPSGLEVASDVLFAPQNGHSYTEDDWKRCMAQQPISKSQLPTYLDPYKTAKYNAEPPLLKYGWRTRAEDLIKVIIRHFPEKVIYGLGGYGHLSDPDHPEWQDSTKQLCPSRGTIFHYWVQPAVCKKLELDDTEIIEFCTLWDQDVTKGHGLIVGNNFDGIIDNESIEKVRKFFNFHGEPQWYLDADEWYWQKNDPKRPTILKDLGSDKVAM
ncbi:hypothetical protein BDW22DRAFT_1001376 [Trametopsis cervina]|nr:hypothetical protein BDW22DRAFT_1001376 [Trametopsis cervina]